MTSAVVLLLLGATAARAQPEPPRTHRQRSVTLSGNPTDPAPEVHGAPGLVMTFLFDGPLVQASVQVDTSRIRVLDVGSRSLLLEPVADFRADERTEVRVLLADGEPRRAVFGVVAHPSEVDTQIDVVRLAPPPDAACQARVNAERARCGALSPIAFRLSDVLSTGGILMRPVKKASDSADSIKSVGGVSFLGASWALVDVQIRNLSGQSWAPRGGVLKSRDGDVIDVRQVHVAGERIAPGTMGRVLVETDVPPPKMGTDFTLHLHGEDGRSVPVPHVEMPPRPKKAAR